MATSAPSAARRLAIAAPIPREPPVMSAIFPSSFFDIVVSPCSRHMPIRHELKSHCSPNAFQSLHWIRELENSRTMEHTFLSWERCFTSMGAGNGITTSALLHRGCRGRESDGGGGAKTAHVTTFIESADSRP